MWERVRAAVLLEPGRYEIQEFARPRLEPGAALMRMDLSGICGTDKHTYQGKTRVGDSHLRARRCRYGPAHEHEPAEHEGLYRSVAVRCRALGAASVH